MKLVLNALFVVLVFFIINVDDGNVQPEPIDNKNNIINVSHIASQCAAIASIKYIPMPLFE
jgi:hypothetical protein